MLALKGVSIAKFQCDWYTTSAFEIYPILTPLFFKPLQRLTKNFLWGKVLDWVVSEGKEVEYTFLTLQELKPL